METMAASDLASLLVEESLGFAGGPAKLDALRRIDRSLRSCTLDGEGGDNDDAEASRLRHEWRGFLEGASDGPDVLLRDTFVNCLVECCRPGEDEGEEDEEVIFDVIEVALRCLSRLVCLRCVEADASGKKKKRSSSVPPIFGHDFVANIAADVVQALRLDDGSSLSAPQEGVSHAASELIIALLRADRPRNEMCTPTIRDMILLPASAPDAAPEGSVACIAEALCASILAGVDAAVPGKEGMDEVELQMRRETAALSQLQHVKDVMMHVGLTCSKGLGPKGESPCSRRILAALQGMYDIGAFAVESQLETLLDDKAAPILARLDKESMADQMIGAPADAMEMDDDADGEGAELEDACALAPLYAHMARPPMILTTVKNLDSMLVAITESLSATDAELWDERLNALFDLECILAGGVASMGHDARHLFVERLRKMPLGDQFTDLRSQITQQACRVIVATAFEFRDYVAEDSQLNQNMSLFVERCLPSVLDLCKSGTRLMAAQGMNCLLSLACVGGDIGYARLVPRFCDEILGKKVHKNRKRGSVMALTGALRVWDATCFVKYLDELTKAVKEAATNRDPAVREEGRKLYWACLSCEETAICVQGMFDGRSREMKNLKKEREGIDSEWEVDGIMSALVRTGVLGEASEKPAKKAPAARPSTAPSRGVPPRNSIKRPASSRLRAEHGTPFKATRTSTPMKSAKDASSTKKRLPPSSGSKQLSTPTMQPGTSPRKFSESKASNRLSSTKRLPSRPSSVTAKKAKDATPSGASVNTIRSIGGKENTVAMRTPAKSVGFNVNSLNPASPMVGTPVVNLLARASPLSAERIRNTEDVLGVIIDMLSDKISPHEQSLGIKALALFAKENPNDPSWEEKFPEVLACLLEHIKDMPAEDFSGPVDFIRSPTKNISSCHQMQHLFIQALRNLLQFVPGHVKRNQVKDIICCMIECTKDAPFDVVHTAERALSNLVDCTQFQLACFENLLQFTSVEIDLNDKQNPPALLSTLRTMMQLIDRISVDSLKKALPSLLPLFRTALCHKSMDMRKATVFLLVEMHFVLGDELGLDDLTDSQQRLLNVYIEKHPKNTRMVEATS